MKNLNAAPKAQFFTAAGIPLVGGKLYTYVAGTSTPQATYTTAAGVTANTNPIILDSRGECNLWLTQDVSYKFILNDATDVLIWSVDNVASLSGLATQSASAVAITGGSISGLSPPLPIASGGTGASTAATARTALGLGTYAVLAVPVAASTKVMLGDAVSVTAEGATGQILVGNTGAAPTWATLAGVLGQVFTATGTFTIPAGITALKVTTIGGGGSGAGSAGGYSGGGGGGAAATAISYLTALTPGNTIAVVVGTGGAAVTGAVAGNDGVNSTIASGTQTITTVTAGKGLGAPVVTGSGAEGGAGGTATNGSINILGGDGAPARTEGGNGGASSMGGGGRGGTSSVDPGIVGKAYGSGGGGAANPGAGASGAGKAGIVIFEW